MAPQSMWAGILLAAVTTFHSPAGAQVPSGMIPGGSYVDSCKDIVFDAARSLLYATCDFNDPGGLLAKGEPVRSAQGFPVANCVPNSIFNDNGSLYCFTSKPWGTGHVIPEGSYRASCTRSRVLNNVLIAECDDSQDETHAAELNLNACRWGGDISNDNGRLRCQSILATHTHEVGSAAPPSEPPLVKPVAVEPAPAKPVMIAPVVPAEPGATEAEGETRKKRRRNRGERG